ncbi:MAG: hypothetical protein KF773_24925 [Deltaproteobacteria bacterium]|nr:hypothetical protein [Deltaproteobacteria bacterium]
MEAATHQPTNAPAPLDASPPKLTIEKFADAGIACLKFAGTIDESFEGKRLGDTAAGDVLVLDLGGVKKISSFGIREWVDFVGAASKRVRSMVLIECAPKVVDQLNMVANFAGGGRVFSFYAPFRCDYCDSEHRVLLQVDKDHETIKSMKLAERPCPSCKEGMYFDDDGATYFSYLLGQEKFELEPEVAAFLSSKLSYAVSDLSRKLRVDKVIEGRTTYLRLAGDLDGMFPREKLAEGLEGTVILDVGSVGRIEPAGAAEWRGFVQMVSPLVDALYLASVPAAFLEKLCGREDLGPKGMVLTFVLPFACKACGTTTQQTIDVEAHHDVLKFATAPELRCTGCKGALQCAASENLMSLLPELPKPSHGADLVRSIGMLRERAVQAAAQHKRSDKKSVQPIAVPEQRTSLLVPFLAASLAVVLAAGGYLAYQRFAKSDEPTGSVQRSAQVRPAWSNGLEPATASCTAADGGLACAGASSLAPRQDEAEDEAADAALEALAHAIGEKIADAKWQAVVPALYRSTRDAKLAAFKTDPASATARREVRDGRRTVAASLRASSGGIVHGTPADRYWEERGGADGKRFAAFARVGVTKAELAKLVAAYAKPSEALGATVVDAFPLVAWRYPKLERGAIVVGLAAGQLQEIGVDKGYVVLSIDGRDVGDGAAFARLALDEVGTLAIRGGSLRLKVQTPDPEPREFSAAVAAVAVDPPPGDPKKPGGGRTGPGPTPTNGGSGGVNVWDRLGGGGGAKGGGRDDPNQ